MKLLAAEIEIDGNLRKGVVVDVSEDGAIRSAVSLSDLPCEPANTVYYGGRLVVCQGRLNSASMTAVAMLTLSDSVVSAPCG